MSGGRPVRGRRTPGPPAPAGRPGPRPAATWLILGAYLLGAVALTWHLWADPAGRAQVVPGNGVSHDIDLFAWFVRYEATAIAHGRLPDLVTTALNAPQGVNLMWNTSFLLPGVVFAPLTLAVGAQATLTTVLTLGFAGSAATMFWVLRRWGASLAAAALGGAVFGFSPALRIAAVGHYHLQFAVLLPLMIDALLRLVTGRAGRYGPGPGWACSRRPSCSSPRRRWRRRPWPAWSSSWCWRPGARAPCPAWSAGP